MSAPRVLIVDDDEEMLAELAVSLGQKLDLTVVSGGRAALAEIARKSFDAIVLDLHMPDFDGEAVLQALAQRGSRPPVILASGLPMLPRIAATWHVRDWIRKPFRVDYLMHKIYGIVRH
jgi:DNA-binding response OmpR family regulator